MKNLRKLTSAILCVAFVLSMLMVGVMSASAAEITAPEGQYAFKLTNKGNSKGNTLSYGYSPTITMHTDDHIRFSFYYKSEDADTTFPDFSDRKTPFYLKFAMKTEVNADTTIGMDTFDVKTIDKVWYQVQYDMTVPETMNGWTFSMLNITVSTNTGKEEAIYLADFKLCRVIDGVEQENVLGNMSTHDYLTKLWDSYPGTNDAWFIYHTLSEDKKTYAANDGSWSFSIVSLESENYRRPERYFDLTLNDAKTSDGKTNYKFGETVTVKANDAPEGMEFDYWTVGGITAAELGIAAGDAEITFEMPDRNITLTANYTETDNGSDDNGGTSGGDNNSSGDNNNNNSGSDNNSGNGNNGSSDTGNTENPKTGDTFPVALWCGIVCCAALAVGVTVRKKALAK